MTEPKPPKPVPNWIATVLIAGALVGLTALATVAIEHRIHGDKLEHVHHEDEHGEDEPGEDEHSEGHEGHDDKALGHLELTPEQLTEAEITFTDAAPGKVAVGIDLPAEIVLNGDTMAHVGPRVGGTVRTIHKRLGEDVKKGDVLAVLDSADVAERQGEVQAARERVKLTKTEYERKKKLYKEKITSQKDYIRAKQAYAEAKVELRAVRRTLAAKTGGRGTSGGYSLVAPLSGTIVAWHLGVGEVLEENTRAYTIADMSSVWVNVSVYAKDLPRIRRGQRAVVRADGIDKPAEGTISYLSQTVGKLSRSATARIVLDKPDEGWRPGLFVTAEIEIDEVDAQVVVPEESIVRLGDRDVVFVQEEHIEVRPIVRGRHGHIGDAKVVEVVSGLKAGARVAFKNSFLLKAELKKSAAGHQH